MKRSSKNRVSKSELEEKRKKTNMKKERRKARRNKEITINTFSFSN